MGALCRGERPPKKLASFALEVEAIPDWLLGPAGGPQVTGRAEDAEAHPGLGASSSSMDTLRPPPGH
jgi:hypothetical protein